MGALSDYIAATQNLLHDSTYNFWSASELTRYVNAARVRVALDSKGLRQLVQNVIIKNNVETYAMAAIAVANIAPGYVPVDVMGVTIYWGNLRAKLIKYGWQKFDMLLRAQQNFSQTPVSFCRYGAGTIFIGPVPNQDYISEWDISLAPPPLVLDTDAEPIPVPYQEPVPYWAARLAKYKTQDLGEGDIFEAIYKRQLGVSARQFNALTVSSAYSIS